MVLLRSHTTHAHSHVADGIGAFTHCYVEHILQLNSFPVVISNDEEDNKSMKQLDNHYNHLRAALNCV